MDSDPDEPSPSFLPDIVGGAGSALFATLALRDPAMGAFVGSALAPPLSRLVERALLEIHSRHMAVMDSAASVTDMTKEQVIEAALANEAVTPLLIKVLRASEVTTFIPKLEAMGGVFGQAVMDDAKVDEAAALVDTLDALNESHIRVLRVLSGPFPPRRHDGTNRSDAAIGWWLSQIRGELPETGTILESVIGTIERHGLASDHASRGFFGAHEPCYQLTEYGNQLVALLGDAAAHLSDRD